MVAAYNDIAISGASAENRLGFQRMIADAISPEHPFDMIIVYDISRFTRSLAGKPLAGFCATRSRRIQVLYGMVVHVIRCNIHYFINNRR